MDGASKVVNLYPGGSETGPEISPFRRALTMAQEQDNSPEAAERHALRAKLSELIANLSVHDQSNGQALTNAQELLTVLDANPYLGAAARTEVGIEIGRHLPPEYEAMHQGLLAAIRGQVASLQACIPAIQVA